VRVIDEGWVTVETAAHAADVEASALLELCRAGTIDSVRDRQSPHQRFVCLEAVRQYVIDIKGRPQTSLQHLIASTMGTREGPSSEARISELQGLIRDREYAS
jgi:hypothetical protein